MGNFITVYDALKTCDKNKLYQEVLKRYKDDDSKEACTLATMEFVDKCLKLKPKKYKSHFICVCLSDYYNCFDNKITKNYNSYLMIVRSNKKLTTVHLDNDIIKETYSALQSKNYTNNTMNSFYNLIKKFRSFTHYSYEFCTTNKILGFLLSTSVIKRYGLEWILAQILFEMTFFGYDIQNNENLLDESIEDCTDDESSSSKVVVKALESDKLNVVDNTDNRIDDNKASVLYEELPLDYSYRITKISDDYTEYQIEDICYFNNEVEEMLVYNLFVKDYLNQKK